MTDCISLDIFNNITCLPEYAIAPDVTSVEEGDSVTFTVTTVNVPDGTDLYWILESSGGTVVDADFSSPSNAVSAGGTVTINSNTASFVVTLADDGVDEVGDTFIAKLSTACEATVVATSPIVSINDAEEDGGTPITVPGYVETDITAAWDVRFSGNGQVVAWAVRKSSTGTTSVYVYSFSSGAFSVIDNTFTGNYAYSVDLNYDGSKLLVGSSGAVVLLQRSGNNYTSIGSASTMNHPFKNTFVNYTGGTNTRARFAYNYTRIILGQSIFKTTNMTSPIWHTSKLEFVTVLPNAPSGSNFVSAWTGNSIVGHAYNTGQLTNSSYQVLYAWRTTNGTSFTAETIPQIYMFNKINGGALTKPSVSDIEMNPAGDKVAMSTSYGGAYGPMGLIYQRVSANNWTLVKAIPSDPMQTTQVGTAMSPRTVCWSGNGSEIAIGGSMGATATENNEFVVYMFSSGGSLLRKVAEIGRANSPKGLAYHPSQAYIALAISNGTPKMVVYSY